MHKLEGKDMNEFQTNIQSKKVLVQRYKGYQPRTNIMRDKKGDPLPDSHSVPDLFVTITCQLLR